MQFKDIPGQGPLAHSLHQLVRNDRLPHAMLLLGSSGGAQLPMALALAQAVLCETPSAEDSCGHCPSCIKAKKLVHPDLHLSFPYTQPKATSEAFLPQWREAVLDNPYLSINDWLLTLKAENKKGEIYVTECNRIIQKLSLKTFEGKRKVLLLWRAESLGLNGNRLLKLIEEPPEGTVIILVAEDAELILNTILSRCQLVKVPAFSDEAIAEGLESAGLAQGERAMAIARIADGDMHFALESAGEAPANQSAEFLRWMRLTFEGKPPDMVDFAKDIAKRSRDQQKLFLQYGLHFIREIMSVKTMPEARVRLQEEEVNTARKMAAFFSFEQLEALARLFSDDLYALERYANSKLLFLDTSICMHRVQRKPSAIVEGRLVTSKL